MKLFIVAARVPAFMKKEFLPKSMAIKNAWLK
jgi:hypothetical protein